ncbi:MAG: manganese efflux pump MntP family protein [Traorella sp.]
MDTLTLITCAIGLAMDAFAVSICKGLAMKKSKFKHQLTVGIWFGGFQGLMPLVGYFLGVNFKDYIVQIDHWVAFILLAFIGLNMIKESFEKDCEECADAAIDPKSMFPLAIATSIDALAVGITFAFLDVNIMEAVLLIGIITCVLSMIGVKVGNIFGMKYKSKAEFAGGVVLVILGIKILLEHLGIL